MQCNYDDETGEPDCSTCDWQTECEVDWLEEQAERDFQEKCDYVSRCQCGAWQEVNGKIVHVADCVCGAQ